MKRKYYLGLGSFLFLFVLLLAGLLIHSHDYESQAISGSSDAAQLHQIPKLMLPVLAESLGNNEESYHIRENNDFLSSTTKSIKLQTEYTSDGVIFSRDGHQIRMNLLDSSIAQPEKVSANRVEYKRGNITEWYVNSPLGVEQGFTIQQSPIKNNSKDKVVFEVGVDLDHRLEAKQINDQNSIVFSSKDEGTNLLSYSGLFAYDSSGKELPSEMEFLDSKIRIAVDDSNAEYPIVIDPFIEIQKILPSDVNPMDVSWQFGGTVSISGNTAIVGAIHANNFLGQAYIFDRDLNTGFWSETQILSASNVGSFFGNCVHIDGDTAIVGSLNILSAIQGDAYVYERNPMTNMWSEVDNITGSTGAAGDFYGISCSVEENRGIAMVGANLAFGAEGRVYIYQRDMMNSWNEIQILTPSGGMPVLQFGFKLNFQGDTAAVGAPSRLDAVPLFTGEVYIYERDTMTNLWNEIQVFTGSDSVAGDSFGVDVDFDGDNMVVGASQANANTGKAYIFERDTMTSMWNEVQILTATMPIAGEFYGSNVSIQDDIAFVSASLLITTPGRVFVYERDTLGMWPEVQEIVASDGMPGDLFGVETSISGNQLIVGATGVDGAAGTTTGAAYLYGDNVTLEVELIGDGSGIVTSSPPGIDCGSMVNDCSEDYQYQTVVELTAVPNPGSVFLGWSGDCSGIAQGTSILMIDDSVCIAEFGLGEFVLNPIFPALDDNINFITAENAAPLGNVAFVWGKKTGSFNIGGRTCNGLELGISSPKLLAIVQANEFAVATYIFYIPFFSDLEFQVQLQAIDIVNCRVSNIVSQVIRKDESG